MDINSKINPAMLAAQAAKLTPDQKAALEKLHTAATQFEGVFLTMLFKAMHDTVPKSTIFGKDDNTEATFSGMLDDQRAQTLAQSGSLGIAKVMENQLRASVLADSKHESSVHVDSEIKP
jgi:Rod binding domain-containing protein